MDGKVIIDVELGTKSFEKQIKQTEQELINLETKRNKLAELNAKAEGKNYRVSNDTYKELQKLGIAVEDIGNKETFSKLEQEIERTKNKLIDLNAKQDELNKKDTSNIDNSIKNIGNSTENVIKKVAKWGLAVFGVRSAYMFIRQSMSTLSQYDDKLATDIQYIRYVLASALKPIIETIINLVYKLLAYIGYIAKAWFGVNIFANASAKAFQKVNKGVKDTNKSAQKLQKTLAGFDEMNILQENGSVGTGGGGGGISSPSMDLGNLEDIEIPHWLEVLGENGETVKNIIIGIAEAFAMWKMVKWASDLGLFATNFKSFSSILQTAGIMIFIVGIANAIGDLINLIIDPSWDNFAILVGDLSLALFGLSAALIAVNASNPLGWIGLVVGGLGMLITKLHESSDANEDLAKKTKSVAQAEEDLENAREARVNASKKYAQAIKDEESSLKKLNKIQKDTGISGEALHKEILIGTKNYKDLTPKQREVYDAYLDHLSASEKLTKATEDMTKATWDEKQAHHELTGAVYNEKQVYDGWFQTMIDGYRNNKIGASEMANAMKTAMNEMSDTARRDFINNLPDDIRSAFNYAFDGVVDAATGTEMDLEKVYVHFKDGMQYSYKELGDTTKKFETESQKTSKGFSTVWGNATKNIQSAITKIKEFAKILEKLPFGKTLAMKITTAINSAGSKNAKGAIYYPPKLAVGGIINQPGRGVPLALGGERGAEGVIPLTDSQQMNLLGEAIGKYITVNATIVNQMNGRVISRELKQIQNDEDFAFNGG